MNSKMDNYIYKTETGTRYDDDSGWSRWMMLDTQQNYFEMEISGSKFGAPLIDSSDLINNAEWIISALQKLLAITISKGEK